MTRSNRLGNSLMAPYISFEGAHDFELSGGNFGKVRGSVKTINADDVRSSSRVLKYLTAGNHDRQRPSSDPRPRRASRIHPPTHPPVFTSATHSSTLSDSSDSESSDFEGLGTDSTHSDCSTPFTSLDDLHQPPANSLGLDGVPPPQSQFQPPRPPHEMPNIRSPQVQPRRAESRASTLPAYSARVRDPLQNPQNITPVPPRPVNMEPRRHPSSYPRPPTSAHTTPRAHHPPPFSRPNDTMVASPHPTNHATPRLRNLPAALPRPTTVTSVLASAPQHQPSPHSQSASSRIHSRPLPHIPGTSSAFPPPTRAPSANVTPSRVIQPQASSSSANAMRDVRIHGGHNLDPITGGDVRVNSTLTSQTQSPIFNYGYPNYHGCPSPHLYPYGQYTAPTLPFALLYPQYNHPHMARADVPWGRSVPQPQWPQQDQHGYQYGEPVPYAIHSPGAGGSSDGTPMRRGL